MTEASKTSLGAVAGALRPSRIADTFARCKAENRGALMPFMTPVGYPTLERSEELLVAIAAGGADLVEIGVPFSDPLADGATVQAASQKALENGTTLADCLALTQRLRDRGIDIPILLMGYTNPFYQYGLDRLASDAAEVGVDGFLIPDLPSDEAEEFQSPLKRTGRDLVFFVSPTSTESRIIDATSNATGFIYCVSLRGVTGARSHLSEELPKYIARVRAHTDVPLAIGFGISTPEHVAEACAIADGAIVASALIDYVDSLPAEEQAAGAERFVRQLAAATRR